MSTDPNKQTITAKMTEFMQQNSKLKNKKKKHRKEAAPEVADIVAGSAQGVGMTEIATATSQSDGKSDVHFSKIDVKRLSLAAERKTFARSNKKQKKGAKASKAEPPPTNEEFLKVFYQKVAGGATSELKMEIAAFVLGSTSILDWEGTLAKKKADKSHENDRGDCYFLAILWAGLLEGRIDEDNLTQEQRECLEKIYEIGTRILELMFDAKPYEKFRIEAIEKAQDMMRQDYIDHSEQHRGNSRAILSPTEIDEIEVANPALEASMLVLAKKIFLENANQYPGRPEPEDLAAGRKTAQMISMRQKCYPFQKDKFDKDRDSKKKFEPLPGVKSDYEHWPEIQARMTDSVGRRSYNPIVFANATNGVIMERPPVSLKTTFVNQAGERVTESQKYPDPGWNPTVRKTVRTVDEKGRVIDEKTISISCLVSAIVKFTPYAGPDQYGVRLTMNGVVSIIDHVPYTQRIVTTKAKYARSYDYDDSVRVITAPPVAKKEKVNDDGDESGSYEGEDDDDSASGSKSKDKSQQQQARPPPVHQQQDAEQLPSRDANTTAKSSKRHEIPPQTQQPALADSAHTVVHRSRHALPTEAQQWAGVPQNSATAVALQNLKEEQAAAAPPPRRHSKTSATPTKTPSSPAKVSSGATGATSTSMAVDTVASTNKRSRTTRDQDVVVNSLPLPPKAASRHAIQIPPLNEESSSSDDEDDDDDEGTEEDESGSESSEESAAAPPPPPQKKSSDKHKSKKAKTTTAAVNGGGASSTLAD